MSEDKADVGQGAPTRWEKLKPDWGRIQAFIVKNYLPLAFLVALGFALAYPVPGRYLANIAVLGNVRIVQVVAMALVFLITGLQLNTTELKRALALRNLPNILYGFVAILVITPCLGFALREAPLDPPEFATGLAIFCVAPTTLGVGVALTEACGGNRAVALLLTIGTNALAVFTMPPQLRLLLPAGTSASGEELNLNFQITDLLVKLAVTVLVPFTIGKVVRELVPPVAAAAKAHRVAMSLTSTTALAFVVWQTLSAARDTLLQQQPGPVFAMMGLTVAQHIAYLIGNYLIVWLVLRAPLKEAIAVVIMASQKSAPVAVTAITFMTTDSVQQGLLSLPSIVGQLIQIFIGAAIAKWLSRVVKKADRLEAEAAAAAAAAAAQPDAVSLSVVPGAAAAGAAAGGAGGCWASDTEAEPDAAARATEQAGLVWKPQNSDMECGGGGDGDGEGLRATPSKPRLGDGGSRAGTGSRREVEISGVDWGGTGGESRLAAQAAGTGDGSRSEAPVGGQPGSVTAALSSCGLTGSRRIAPERGPPTSASSFSLSSAGAAALGAAVGGVSRQQ